MNRPINIRELAAGTRVLLATGAKVEIVANPQDGIWLFARYLSPGNSTTEGQEEMIFAQDVVEVCA